MSCKDCEEAQEVYVIGILTDQATYSPYFRIGNGNVQVICCAKHAKELQDIIRRDIK